jgi:DNA uptake protein ComE-like DNA-binding protein
MIRSSRFHTLTALVVALMLPIAAHAAGTAKSSTAATKATKATKATASHPARMPAMDINTASKEDLMKLPGVTEDLAQKIIDSRPYKSKAELTKKNVLTKTEYGKVRSHVIAKQEPKAPEAKSMESTPAPGSK